MNTDLSATRQLSLGQHDFASSCEDALFRAEVERVSQTNTRALPVIYVMAYTAEKALDIIKASWGTDTNNGYVSVVSLERVADRVLVS